MDHKFKTKNKTITLQDKNTGEKSLWPSARWNS